MGLLLHFWLGKLNKQNCLAKICAKFYAFLAKRVSIKSAKRERKGETEREIDGCIALFRNRKIKRERQRFCAYFWQNCNAIAELACLEINASIDKLPLLSPLAHCQICVYFGCQKYKKFDQNFREGGN